jgi:hypothetical protein
VKIEDVEEGVDERVIVDAEKVVAVEVIEAGSDSPRINCADANNAASSDGMRSAMAVTVK